MGVVYRAEHLKTGAPAAIKTVHLPHEDWLHGIRREIHALSRLRHPGVVRILDQGLWEGWPWYAMELLEGVALRQLVGARPPAPLRTVLTLVRRICAPLGFLHGEGIVHRDLKPDNVLLVGSRASGVGSRVRQNAAYPTPDTRFPTPDFWPVLVDFGLAAQFAGKVSREAIETGGASSGTVAYMAPEQIQGELVDARADLYSLGCMLYELVTGRRPFVGGNVPAIVQAHLHSAPDPPSELVDSVPEELDALILRLLAKRPKDRPGHAGDVAAALAALGAEDGLAAAGPRPRTYLYRPGFTGRDEPMRELAEHLSRLEQGKGGLALVGGESGVGKTRLAMELARQAARRKLRVLVGESVTVSLTGEEGAGVRGAALQALRPVLQAIADRCRDRGLDETERGIGSGPAGGGAARRAEAPGAGVGAAARRPERPAPSCARTGSRRLRGRPAAVPRRVRRGSAGGAAPRSPGQG
jgi:protein kinase-like protein/AAA ATPase-like protein